MRVRMLIGGRIVRIIHACSEVRIAESLILMIKTEGMTNLLTQHKILPCRGVICCGIEVRIIHFDDPLRNVAAAYPDLRDAEPSIIAILPVADFYSSAR